MLKKGDVIFISDSMEKNISGLSVGYAGYSYYHCGLYIGDNQIIEAWKIIGVVKSNISKYADKKILIARTSQSEIFLEKVIMKAEKFLGYSYNDLFLPNTSGKLYCSELIHEAFRLANKEDFFKKQKLNYISKTDSLVSQYWLDFYAEYGMKVPQGEHGSHPNNLSLDIQFKDRFFLKNN